MPTKPKDPLVPSWTQDQLDSPSPPEVEAPYFDHLLNAWVLTRHADILAAFRESSLIPASPQDRKTPDPSDDRDRARIRAETTEALSPVQIRAWRERLTPEVEARADRLPIGEPLDLMDEYARPLCLSLAAFVTGIARDEATRLHEKAQRVSAATAEPYDPGLRVHAKAANAQLRTCFHSGPEPLRDSGFVALSQTLPSLVGNAWFGLIQHPQQWSLLHQQPALTEQAIEELLRYSGLARTLTRVATADINLNGSIIRQRRADHHEDHRCKSRPGALFPSSPGRYHAQRRRALYLGRRPTRVRSSRFDSHGGDHHHASPGAAVWAAGSGAPCGLAGWIGFSFPSLSVGMPEPEQNDGQGAGLTASLER